MRYAVAHVNDPLDLPVTRERLDVLRAQSLISDEDFERALAFATTSPDVPTWQRFISAALLTAGAVLVAAGILFFVAYDWAGLHRLQKLALAASALVLTTGFAILRADARSGRAALAVSTILVGALLAVFGQVYQTGADTWQLFAGWAVLALPFVLLSQTSLVFVIELVIVDLALMLFFDVDDRFGGEEGLVLVLSLVNGGAWIGAEFAAHLGVEGLATRTLSRVLSCFAFAPLVVGVVMLVIDEARTLAPLVITGLFVVACAATVYAHNTLRRDVFTLTVLAASLLVVFATVLARFFFETLDLDELGFLLEGALLVGAVGVAIHFLRAEALAGTEVRR